MKISELASELISIYGDIEVVEMLHIDDTETSEPYSYEEIIASTLRRNGHIHPTELLTYHGHNGEKQFVSSNLRGYIDGAIEKALLIDFGRYIEDDETYNNGD